MDHQTSLSDVLAHVLSLMNHSPIHRRWFIEDIFRLIIPAIQLNQAVYHVENGRLLGFGTFALLTPEKAKAFLEKNEKLFPADFRAGDCPVLLDAIAPFGHAPKVTRKIRNALVELGYKGKPILFRRNYSGRTRISRAVL